MSNELGRMEGWILFDDHKIDEECSGIGMVYGVHMGHVEQIFEEAIRDINVNNIEIDLSGTGCVNFEINNITYCEGQMTFPETGQWDFPPHWEFDFKVLEIERFDDEGEKEVTPAVKFDPENPDNWPF